MKEAGREEEEEEVGSAEVELTDQPELREQFRQNYGISGADKNVPDGLMEASLVDDIPRTNGRGSQPGSHDPTDPVNKTSQTTTENPSNRFQPTSPVSLADLARSLPSVVPSTKTSTDRSQHSPLSSDGEDNDEQIAGSRVTCEGGDAGEGGGGSEGGEARKPLPRDLLFFMRDQKSQTELQGALHGRFGRAPREVGLVQCEGGVGVELVGLSASGVFVNELREGGVAASCDLLQLGDQILQVNEEPVEGLASFEVELLLSQQKTGQPFTLLVQHNPLGFSEVNRSRGK